MIEKSLWAYETAASGGASIGELMLSGGKIILKAPDNTLHSYRYAGMGVGVGMNFRVPKNLRLPDIVIPRSRGTTLSASGSTTDFQGGGVIYRMHESELKPGDFAGMTMYVDASAGLLVSEGVSGFITGIDEKAMIPWLFNPALFANVISASAKAFMVLRGMGEGLVDGAGMGLMLGSITYTGPYAG